MTHCVASFDSNKSAKFRFASLVLYVAIATSLPPQLRLLEGQNCETGNDCSAALSSPLDLLIVTPHNDSIRRLQASPLSPCPSETQGLPTLSAGWWHTCAVSAEGSAICWGCKSLKPDGYAFYNDDYADPDGPTGAHGQCTVPFLATAPQVAMAVGPYHSCSLSSQGKVECWGCESIASADNEQCSVSPGALSSQVAVAAGVSHTCSVSSLGRVICWGCASTSFGQCTVPFALVQQVAVAAGEWHTCSLSSLGQVTCWGCNAPLIDAGQCNVAPGAYLGGQIAIAVGRHHSCSLSIGGDVICWGCLPITVPASEGQPAFTYSTDIGQCSELANQVSITAGTTHTCSLSAFGGVLCWGDNFAGQTLVPETANSNQVSVSAGGWHTCSLSTLGSVTCWGCSGMYANYGQCDPPTSTLVNVALPCSQFGVDVSTFVSSTAAQQMATSGVVWIAIRAWHSYGAFDETSLFSLFSFASRADNHNGAASVITDVYLWPCRRLSGAAQANALLSKLSPLKPRLWLDVENDETNPSSTCNWNTAVSSQVPNCDYVVEIITAIQSSGISVGLYTRENVWTNFTGGLACSLRLPARMPLWYARYDNGNNNFFDDPSLLQFLPLFGKQYAQSVPLFGMGVDLNLLSHPNVISTGGLADGGGTHGYVMPLALGIVSSVNGRHLQSDDSSDDGFVAVDDDTSFVGHVIDGSAELQTLLRESLVYLLEVNASRVFLLGVYNSSSSGDYSIMMKVCSDVNDNITSLVTRTSVASLSPQLILNAFSGFNARLSSIIPGVVGVTSVSIPTFDLDTSASPTMTATMTASMTASMTTSLSSTMSLSKLASASSKSSSSVSLSAAPTGTRPQSISATPKTTPTRMATDAATLTRMSARTISGMRSANLTSSSSKSRTPFPSKSSAHTLLPSFSSSCTFSSSKTNSRTPAATKSITHPMSRSMASSHSASITGIIITATRTSLTSVGHHVTGECGHGGPCYNPSAIAARQSATFGSTPSYSRTKKPKI